MQKKYELLLIFIIAGIVLISVSGTIENIINKTLLNGAMIKTRTLMNTIEQISIEQEIQGESSLPLIAVFYDEQMYLKNANKNYQYNGSIKFSGGLPTSGEIVVTKEGKVIADKVKINNYVCNTLKANDIICKKA